MPNPYQLYRAPAAPAGREEFTGFTPTLFVGLGGTGKDVMLRFRKNLYDEYGMPNEQFARFLVLDTDDQPYTPEGGDEEAFRAVELKRDDLEFIRCTISPNDFHAVFDKIRNEHARCFNWVHPELENVPDVTLSQGAGTIRQIGRLAFFLRYSKIRSRIESICQEMLAYAAKQAGTTTVFKGQIAQIAKNKLEVVIVTSLAGGTGSGLFIDLAYLVKDILVRRDVKLDDYHISLIAILPTVFLHKEPPAKANRLRQNAYAALLEMEKYSTPRPFEDPFSSHEEDRSGEPIEYRVDWGDTARPEIVVKGKPWGTCYLIDDVNNIQPNAARSRAEIFQMVADYLFHDFGTTKFAVAKRSERSNMGQFEGGTIDARVLDIQQNPTTREELERSVLFRNMYGCSFNSFGLAQVLIDKDRIERSAACRLAIRLIAHRWIGDPGKYTANKYESWAKEDLLAGRTVGQATEAVSFHPDEMWRELLRGDDGKDWLAEVDRKFEQLGKLERTDPAGGAEQLQAALNENREALALKTDATGLPGRARRTLDARLDQLRGNPADLGRMRKHLKELARDRFNQIGALPAIELLAVYRKAFEHAAKRASEQKKQTTESDQHILARLQDAEQVPFVCRRIALRFEYRRACALARATVHKRYAIAAGEHLEKLSNTLRAYVGGPDAPSAPGQPPTLHEQYLQIADFFRQLQRHLEAEFRKSLQVVQSDCRKSLVPNWTEKEYDTKIDTALLARDDIRHDLQQPTQFDWPKAEEVIRGEIQKILRKQAPGGAKAGSLSELMDKWMQDFTAIGGALHGIAEVFTRACQELIKGRIDLPGKGNVVDELIRMQDERQPLLEGMVCASAPYFPMISEMMYKEAPFHSSVLGRPDGRGPDGQEKAAAVTEQINSIAQDIGEEGLDWIRKSEEGPETAIVFVRELAGLPLHYYARLEKLEDAYKDFNLEKQRKTCHVNRHETYHDLPDIALVKLQDIGLIRDSIPFVLRAFVMRRIRRDDEGGFSIDVPDKFGQKTYRLGSRISRIVRHACERQETRRYVEERWGRWIQEAAVEQVAILLCAITETLRSFPGIEQAHAETIPPPIVNCYKWLLVLTVDDLLRYPQGRAWVDALYRDPRAEHSDAWEQEWRQRYERVAGAIRAACLKEASPDLRLLQVVQWQMPPDMQV